MFAKLSCNVVWTKMFMLESRLFAPLAAVRCLTVKQ